MLLSDHEALATEFDVFKQKTEQNVGITSNPKSIDIPLTETRQNILEDRKRKFSMLSKVGHYQNTILIALIYIRIHFNYIRDVTDFHFAALFCTI